VLLPIFLISIPEEHVPEVRNQGSDTKIIDWGTKEEAFGRCFSVPCMQPLKILCKRQVTASPSHHYHGVALFDLISCTLYVGFEMYTSLGDGECRRVSEKINLCDS
jgi:hypothetical protein